MAKFQVQDQNGQLYEIEGDHQPSAEELTQIFSTAPEAASTEVVPPGPIQDKGISDFWDVAPYMIPEKLLPQKRMPKVDEEIVKRMPESWLPQRRLEQPEPIKVPDIKGLVLLEAAAAAGVPGAKTLAGLPNALAQFPKSMIEGAATPEGFATLLATSLAPEVLGVPVAMESLSYVPQTYRAMVESLKKGDVLGTAKETSSLTGEIGLAALGGLGLLEYVTRPPLKARVVPYPPEAPPGAALAPPGSTPPTMPGPRGLRTNIKRALPQPQTARQPVVPPAALAPATAQPQPRLGGGLSGLFPQRQVQPQTPIQNAPQAEIQAPSSLSLIKSFTAQPRAEEQTQTGAALRSGEGQGPQEAQPQLRVETPEQAAERARTDPRVGDRRFPDTYEGDLQTLDNSAIRIGDRVWIGPAHSTIVNHLLQRGLIDSYILPSESSQGYINAKDGWHPPQEPMVFSLADLNKRGIQFVSFHEAYAVDDYYPEAFRRKYAGESFPTLDEVRERNIRDVDPGSINYEIMSRPAIPNQSEHGFDFVELSDGRVGVRFERTGKVAFGGPFATLRVAKARVKEQVDIAAQMGGFMGDLDSLTTDALRAAGPTEVPRPGVRRPMEDGLVTRIDPQGQGDIQKYGDLPPPMSMAARAELKRLGYTDDGINAMSAIQAEEIIRRQTSRPQAEPGTAAQAAPPAEAAAGAAQSPAVTPAGEPPAITKTTPGEGVTQRPRYKQIAANLLPDGQTIEIGPHKTGATGGFIIASPEANIPAEGTVTMNQLRRNNWQWLNKVDAYRAGSLDSAVRRLRRLPPTKGGPYGLGITPKAPDWIKNFIKNEVVPLLGKTKAVTVDARDLFMGAVFPVELVELKRGTRPVDEIFKAKGQAEKIKAKAAAAFDHVAKDVANMPRKDQAAFIQRAGLGQPQPTADLQALNDLLRTWDQAMQQLHRRALAGGNPNSWMQHHNALIWREPPPNMPRAGLVMPTDFMRYLRNGIAAGGVPRSGDPVSLFLMHAQDVAKFTGVNNAWDGMRASGVVTDVLPHQPVPSDYVRLPNEIVSTWLPKTLRGAGRPKGQWYVQKDVARMLRHYLSKDYIRDRDLGAAAMWLKNSWTAIELNFSPFHAIAETLNAADSAIALGTVQLTHGWSRATGKGPVMLEGLKNLGKGVTVLWPAIENYRLGKRMERMFKSPQEFAASDPKGYAWMQKHYPTFDDYMDKLFTGGMQIKMSDDYRFRIERSFRQALNEHDALGALFHAYPSLARAVMKPLFDIYIPRLKMGTELREFAFERMRKTEAIARGEITEEALARRVHNFIDDRFGEMNFDNLYWDRTFKSAMQFLARSITWKFGTARAWSKALRDTVGAFRKMSKLERPSVTLPMAWLVGMTLTNSIVASLVTQATTGKWPWQLAKDFWDGLRNLAFPRTSLTDPTQRVSIPGYLRDIVHMSRSPTDWAAGGLSGEIERFIEVWNNRDFYGTEISAPDDPLLTRIKDKFIGTLPIPLSLKSALTAAQTGATPGEIGVASVLQKAPSYVSYTPGEQKALELVRSTLKKGSATREEFNRFMKERQATEKIRRGEMTPTEAAELGLVQPNRTEAVRQRAEQSILIHAVKRLSAQQAVVLYRACSAVERDEIRDEVRGKIDRSRTITEEQHAKWMEETAP